MISLPNPEKKWIIDSLPVARGRSLRHHQQEPHTRTLTELPDHNHELALEKVADYLEDQIIELAALRELGHCSDETLSARADIEHRFLECLQILRHD